MNRWRNPFLIHQPTRKAPAVFSFAAAGQKNCKIGKSCGATCINANDDCLLELIPGISQALTKSSQRINGLGQGKSAEEVEELLIKSYAGLDATQKKAFTEFGKLVQEGKVTDSELEQVAELITSVAITPKQADRGAARVMSYEEVKSIHESGLLQKLDEASKNSTKSGVFDPNAPGGMAEYIEKYVKAVEISDKVAELAYSMLPSKARNALNTAGSVSGEGQVYNGVDSKGNPVFGSEGNRARGIMLTKRWMEQDGKDPFTGKHIDIRAGEPEHLFSWSQAKATGGKGDQPGNLAIAAPQTNNSKAAKGVNDDFTKWGEQIKKWYDMGPEKYDREVVQPKVAAAGAVSAKRAGAGSEVEKAFAATTPQERVGMMYAAAKSYGDRVRYLTIAAGLESGQWAQNIPGARKPRRQELDVRASLNIGGKKIKPSEGVLLASAALEPKERAAFMKKVDELRLARTPSTQEIKSYTGRDDPAYQSKMESLDRKFEKDLTALIESTVPSLGSYL
jgi:hypothetical protein